MSEWVYVWAAYGLTWVVLGGYALYLQGRVRRAGDLLQSIPVTGVER